VTGLPVLVHGAALDALVVGGGAVAERKARALVESGARVRVVAPRARAGLRELAGAGGPLSLVEREYAPGDVGDATLVVAATDRRAVNAAVAAEAERARAEASRKKRSLARFLREVVAELRKVIWPGRRELITYTTVVIVFVAFIVALVAGLDLLFAQGVIAVFG
jgi:preprotein translocase SecE subunit